MPTVGIWSSHFLRDLSQVVRRTLRDTPVLLYTRTSPFPIKIMGAPVRLWYCERRPRKYILMPGNDHLDQAKPQSCEPRSLVGTGKRGHYERGLFTGGISKISRFSRISRKWSGSPLFSRVWGFSRIFKFSRISRKWTFLKRPLFQKTPFSEPWSLGCTPRGSCNNALLRRVLRRFSNREGFLEGFLEGACKGFQ